MSSPDPLDSMSAPSERLLHSQRFRSFCFAKFLQLTAQNALIYGLFIFVVRDQETSLATSAFVLASVIPSVILSVPAGVLADALPKKPLLMVSLALRIAIVWLFIDLELDLHMVILLSFLTWTAYQFFTPPENAALTAVVNPASLPRALSLLHALSLMAQLFGAGLIAPLFIKLGDDQVLFWTVFVVLWASGALYFSIPHLSPQKTNPIRERASLWRSLPRGLRMISSNAALARTTRLKVLIDTAMMMVLVAMPIYVEEILQTGAENTIYIALPGAVGLGLGLLVAPALISIWRGPPVALIGFCLFFAALAVLPWVQELSAKLSTGGELPAWTVLLSGLLPLAGLGMALTQVAARAAVYHETEAGSISQVLATQSAIGSVAALVPTVVSGILLDVLPVKAVLVMVALGLAVFGLGNYPRFLGPSSH